jgi:general stress protein 26
MEIIEGMREDFAQSKIVLFTTFSSGGDKVSRPMTNYNEDPYSTMLFPTFKGTKKVDHINVNPHVHIGFPSAKENRFYDIEGLAQFAPKEVIDRKWRWWELYWNEEYKGYILGEGNKEFISSMRVIILVNPVKASLLDSYGAIKTN